jgi:hypothetical protein
MHGQQNIKKYIMAVKNSSTSPGQHEETISVFSVKEITTRRLRTF